MSMPDPPVNVRLVLDDLTEIAVDTVYAGVHDRLHRWTVVNGPPLEQVVSIKIEKLPPRSQVALQGRMT